MLVLTKSWRESVPLVHHPAQDNLSPWLQAAASQGRLEHQATNEAQPAPNLAAGHSPTTSLCPPSPPHQDQHNQSRSC